MIELGLQRISKLLEKTYLPWRAIHIAGTNGKGSVCAYISEMLNTYNRSDWRRHQGRPIIRHGRFTSPHLVHRWDCINLSNGNEMQTVPKELFLETEDEIIKRNGTLGLNASEFELLTATAFEIFTRSKLDVAVIETGIGGRLDATNIIGQVFSPEQEELQKACHPSTYRPRPLVTAITKVGLDHQGFLGDTVEAIAKEKAGIFKPGRPALWDEYNEPSVINILRQEAERKNCQIWDWEGRIPGHQRLPPRLDHHRLSSEAEQHLLGNSSVAFRATWSALSSLGLVERSTEGRGSYEPLTNLVENLTIAPKRVQVPGRLELINISKLVDDSRDVPVLLDGAHNAQSAEVLGKYVSCRRGSDVSDGPTPVIWVLAASDTKDVKEILRPLLQPGDALFAVEFGPVDGMPWVKPMKASDILAAANDLVPGLSAIHDCGANILRALKAADDLRVYDDMNSYNASTQLVVAGSLYLVGDVHRLLQNVSSH